MSPLIRYGDRIKIYPKPYSIYLRGIICRYYEEPDATLLNSRSVAKDLGCTLVLAHVEPFLILQMRNFGLPLAELHPNKAQKWRFFPKALYWDNGKENGNY